MSNAIYSTKILAVTHTNKRGILGESCHSSRAEAHTMLQESAAHAADINKHAATQAVVEDIGSVLRQSTSHT